ncbi:MAG: diguanylate cyclase [Lachnospiraceae bacterium]|nr:diguanylate cyclase [Lachnospiraceae bacterium]
MKQLQYIIKDRESLDHSLSDIRRYYDENSFSGMLIHIYTEMNEKHKIDVTLEQIEKALPEAEYVGCSSNGNIVNGDFSGASFALIATFFESESTRIKVMQHKLTEDTRESASAALVKAVSENEWVKGVEILLTIRGMSLTGLCEGLSKVRPDVQIFGGGAFSVNINDDNACVFSGEGGFEEKGIVFTLMGGDDLHISTSFITGWKPLGSYLNVTDAEGSVLKELNGHPAYETYYKYLRIKNDENFFFHTLEFPFLYHDKGIDIMRAPTACTSDGALIMTSDLPKDSKVRLAYGDPWTVLQSTIEEAQGLVDFAPECISVFSCAGRRTFWGNDKVGNETEAYQKVAPTSGFYTSSEFLREGENVIQHNVTQVIAAMREGEPKRNAGISFGSTEKAFEGRVPMINRMASFIKATMEELEVMAITDGLTGLLNRGEIQRRISAAVKDDAIKDIYLIMMDLDNFKHVNDMYGHKEGDNVLIRLAGMMRETMVDMGDNCSCGRWGGEEFMIMAHSCDEEDANKHAEWIRSTMEKIHFEKAGTVTVSVGVTKVKKGETADQACMRVDKALYQSKAGGRNRVSRI